MFAELLILAAPVAVILAVLLWLHVDELHWEAHARATARPTHVQPFPQGGPVYPRPLDVHRARAARKARHGGTR